MRFCSADSFDCEILLVIAPDMVEFVRFCGADSEPLFAVGPDMVDVIGLQIIAGRLIGIFPLVRSPTILLSNPMPLRREGGTNWDEESISA